MRDAEPIQVVEEKKETVSTTEAAPAQAQQPKAPVEQPVPTQQPAPSPAPQLSKEERRRRDIEHFYSECKRCKVPPPVMVAFYKEMIPNAKQEDAMAEMGNNDRNFEDVLRRVNERRPDNAPRQAQAVNA